MPAVSDLLIIAVCAIVWWIPTFLGLTDLQGRSGLPRPTVWKWTAVLAVPVLGAIVYFWRGRATLDDKHTSQGAR